MKGLGRTIGAAAIALAIVAGLTLMQEPATAQGGSSLYLVEFEASEAGAPTTRDQAIELLDKTIVPSLESLSKDARVVAGGLYVGARAGAFVVNAKSHDEVTELVRALPCWGVWSWKVKPLESFSHRAGLEKKVVEGLKAQK
jgi:hypothetical protein